MITLHKLDYFKHYLPAKMLDKIRLLTADCNLTIVEEIQSLWSDFGMLIRCHSPKLNKNIIVKYVDPPALKRAQHPRGWNTETSHLRKLKSYRVETNFYQNYAAVTDHLCPVPKCIANGSDEDNVILVLDDLNHLGFTERREQGSLFAVKKSIDWLAHFHARFINSKAEGLWSQGGYWYLATRTDELQTMPESELKAQAQAIDDKLKQAHFQTLLHGDAKLQNMCFEPETGRVAAVDFQYVGRGAGIIDLIYLLGSAFEEQDLYKHHLELVDHYFHSLSLAFTHYGNKIDFDALQQEYTELYPFAWADFYRFLLGWNPNSWKVNGFIAEMTELALTEITRK